MKRGIVFPIALVFGSVALTAQSGSEARSKPQGPVVLTQTITVAQAPACPISLRARHGSATNRMEVNDAPPKGTNQMLHVAVTGSDARRIVAASVTVRGWTGKARVVPIQNGEQSTDAAKTLTVRFPASSGKEPSADLLVPGFSAAESIDLNSVTYSDGSTWKTAAGDGCRFPVDGMMLVDLH
jgi:hypothetical protein